MYLAISPSFFLEASFTYLRRIKVELRGFNDEIVKAMPRGLTEMVLQLGHTENYLAAESAPFWPIKSPIGKSDGFSLALTSLASDRRKAFATNSVSLFPTLFPHPLDRPK